jgi:hypothetical protein
MSGVNLVAGFRPELWREAAPDDAPAAMQGFNQNLIGVADSWLIALDAGETKTHATLEIMWPDALLDPLTIYLAVHRPLLSSIPGRWSKPIGNALWVSSDGSPMTEMAIYDRIRKHTAEAFGAAINPHLFRDAAATTLAIEDPAHVRVAAPLEDRIATLRQMQLH